MSTLKRIDIYHVAVPLPVPFRPSWIPGYPQTHNRFDLIRLTTDDGVQGWSAGPAIGHERSGLGDLIGPYLLGLDPTDIPTVQQRLREMSYLGMRNAWIEPAFCELLLKTGFGQRELSVGQPNIQRFDRRGRGRQDVGKAASH